MRRPDPPCLDCEKRRVGCHSQCEEWKAFDAERLAVKKVEFENRKKDHIVHDVVVNEKTKRLKRYGRHK